MSQPISSIMQAIVAPVSMDDTVDDVEAMMKSHHISCAPVYDTDGTILGILTKSDLFRFGMTGKDPKTVKAWEICSYRPIEVTPDTPLDEVADLMLTHRIHHVVVMENEAMKGIVSSLDFVKLFAKKSGH